MARKRKITVEREIGVQEPQEELPEKYKDQSWGDWARGTYAKWWYVLLSITADLFLGLEIARHLTGALGVALPIIVVLSLAAIELYLYHRLWGGLDFIFRSKRYL